MTHWAVSILIVANVVSGIAVVYSTFTTRQLFTELQRLEQQDLQLKTEYSQLLLEKSAWASPGRIEQIARSQLGMREPMFNEVKILGVLK